MVAEVLILTALKEPVKKLANWIFDEVSDGIDNRAIEQSFQNLSSKISNVIMVKTFYHINESIDLRTFYVPTRIKDVSSVVNNIVKIDSGSVVLEGTVGQGKSIFMRYLTYQEANQGNRVPIFFEFRRLIEDQDLEDAISTIISNWIPLFKKENFNKIAESGQVVLFLDGFDEVPQEKINRLINEIEGWSERYPNMQVVISTRPESEIQKSIPFKVYKLAEYEFHEQKELIRKLVSDEEFQENLIKNIEESSLEIKDLLKTPLMVTLFVKQYEVNLKIPKNQSEFYENLFSNIASLHDNTKAGFIRELNSKLDVVKLQEVFEEFCFLTGNSEKLVLSRRESIEIIKKCISNQGVNTNPDDVLKDFSTVVCLLLKDGSEYSFIHRSIQEYFYSSFISRKSSIAKKMFYTKLLQDSDFYMKLRNVVDFLEKSDNYNYYKYFKLLIINSYIDVFDITENSNTLIDSFYVTNVNGSRLEFQIVREGILSYHVDSLPDAFRLLYLSIHKNMKDKYGSMIFGFSDNIENIDESYVKIRDFDDTKLLHLIEGEIVIVGKGLIKTRNEIMESIRKKDDIEFNFE